MTAPSPYLHFAGTARDAMTFYHGIFGGELTLNTNGDFGREEGDADAIGHGVLAGPVDLFAADADPGDEPFSSSGLMFALLGVADPVVLTAWFRGLSEGGTVVNDLEERPWGATDGQVRDRSEFSGSSAGSRPSSKPLDDLVRTVETNSRDRGPERVRFSASLPIPDRAGGRIVV